MREAQVTKDMVRDLLPVYLAGDASADTRAVVEAFLAQDAELRQIVEAAGSLSLPPLEAPASLEMRSLDRTRLLLGRKNFWLGFALIFTFAPLILKPFWLADLVMLIGLGGWAPFLMACRELKATGLEAPRRRSLVLLWAVVGSQIGAAAGNLKQQQMGGPGDYFLPCVTFGLALWIGQKLHQIPTPEELDRPTTLFGKP
jgi:anti-sigma factor RsiW